MTPLTPARAVVRVRVRRIEHPAAQLRAWWAALCVPPVEQPEPSKIGPDALTVQGLEQESGEPDIEVR